MLLPTKNPYVSGEVSVFDTLVKGGEEKSSVTLPPHLHIFLVGCLVEHVRDSDIVHHVLAISLLSSTAVAGEEGNVLLRRTGDEALLLAGLYPERALRLNVSSSYFRSMGQAAYASLSAKLQAMGKEERGKFYNQVAEHFLLLEKVLSAVRVDPDTEWKSFLRFRTMLQ